MKSSRFEISGSWADFLPTGVVGLAGESGATGESGYLGIIDNYTDKVDEIFYLVDGYGTNLEIETVVEIRNRYIVTKSLTKSDMTHLNAIWKQCSFRKIVRKKEESIESKIKIALRE